LRPPPTYIKERRRREGEGEGEGEGGRERERETDQDIVRGGVAEKVRDTEHTSCQHLCLPHV
jgi:hypothetical protein